ncbi:MAG: leucine-rich repeat domain-containing protein, partial [Bacilli bacterium]|nr:leucine-rich repeat domain-containing protein [Bacilli bacterium]
ALDSLETLDLRTNQITDPSVLSDLTNLYSISLEGNNIVDHSSLYGFVERGLISQENIGQITSIEEKKRA